MQSSGVGGQRARSIRPNWPGHTLIGTGFSPVFSGFVVGSGGETGGLVSIPSDDSYTFTVRQIPSRWGLPNPMGAFACAMKIWSSFSSECRPAHALSSSKQTDSEEQDDWRNVGCGERLD